ncbi:MAG: MucR family transcriptional regulator [Syntrophobacteraceae bacterium]
MKKLLDIAAEIVQAQASVGLMSAEQIEQSLVKTFSTLQRIQLAEEKGMFLDCSVSGEISSSQTVGEALQSIQDDKIVCLECGTQMRQLTTKHLGTHNLTPREYKRKWGFSMKQPLSARSLTKARSKAAKKRGLPEKLVKFLEERKQKKLETLAALDLAVQQPGPEPSVKKRSRTHTTA